MERLKNQIPKKYNIQNVLMQIKDYANDHLLTAKQIEDIFHEGIVAGVRNGTLQLPSYSENMLPGVPDNRFVED
jgi:hypothetical protein